MQAKEIALTFDDAPRSAEGHLDGPTRAQLLIEGLKKEGAVETAFFATSSNLDKEGMTRLEAYANAGHIISNHAHTHPDFNQTATLDYINDFKTADRLLYKFPNFEKWFRFPYLREGNQLEKRDSMRTALLDAGYKNAYITINTYDWYMDEQFQKEIKVNPNLDLTKMKSYYVAMLLNAVEHYDEMAIKHLGRSPKHVILLHETDTNALFLLDFVSALKANGWNIISPREAYKDDLSNYVTPNIFKFNPGRIGEVARDKGQTQGLWPESCDEEFLDREFKRQVLQ
ncbi:polysaccharide deacetylase family protein [Bdellovibrio sp. HCB290]|uniref:polysaccharide deacetylase family protein n=1 Tax=Bdellovibrio sp. HCB290 TaxID=3394356 RepID=UPI0039B611F1